MHTIRLSIIIPIYNSAPDISMTLDSCLNQNIPLTAYEIICINDGSTDNSLDLLLDYQKRYSNIHIFTQKNSGVTVARNKGIELAQGEYIWFVDSDDLIASNCLQYLINAISNYNADILNFNRKVESTRKHFLIEETPQFETCEEHDQKKLFFLTYDDTKYMQEVWQYWFKKEFLLQNNIYFNEKTFYGEDTIFSFTATIHAKKCMRTPSTAYLYYNNPKSATKQINNEKRLVYIESLIENARYLKEIVKNENTYWKTVGNLKSNYYIHTVACRLVKEGNIIYAKKTINKLKELRLYPYPIMWPTIASSKGLKQKILSFFRLFLKYKWYLMLFVRLSALKRKIFL